MASASPAAADRRDDLAPVLGAVLYPVQVMAWCWTEAAKDPAFRDAADGWSERNHALLARLEAAGAEAGIGDDERAEADARTLAAIRSVAGVQADRPAYCRAIARLIEAGHFDIDRRDDLEEPLKRIFGVEERAPCGNPAEGR